MAAALRKTGIAPLGDMPWGTHVCVFYETWEDLLDTLASYFDAGLESNEFCVWAVSEPLTVEYAQEALQRRIPRLAQHLAAGRIEILPGREWYLKGGRVDIKRITGGWVEKLTGALASGHEGLRVSGDAFWLASEHLRDFDGYELELETCIAGQRMIVLCTYSLAASAATDVLEVARAHQVTLARRRRVWEVVETPELKQAKEEIRRLNEKLEQRVIDRTRELAAANEQLEAQIAQRVRTEERLRQSEAQLAEGQGLTRTGSWTWNVATGQLRWSEEHFRILGFDPAQGEPSFEEAIGRVHPDDRPALLQTLEKAVADRSEFADRFRIVLPDGSIRRLESLGRPSAADTTGQDYVGTVMDVTERALAEEALQNAQAELARVTRLTSLAALAASIAHEINQPLAAIVTNGEAALRWLEDGSNLKEVRKGLVRMVRDANRAGDVIKRIRALLAKDEAEHVAVDLNHVIREALALMRGVLQYHNIKVRTELAARLPRVRGDPIQLQQVITNLVVNGIEATIPIDDRPRELTIRSETTENGSVLVAVRDSGTGLDPATIDRLFDPFFTTKTGGMGMGLSISASIIEAHGGRLDALPGAPEGSVFQFTLPSMTDGAS